MESAKELSSLIDQYRDNATNGGFLFEQQLGDRLVEQSRNNPNPSPWEKIYGDDGTPRVRFNFVCEFVDQVVAYQKQNNISSVYWDAVNWQGEVIRFPRCAFSLSIMPQDRPILTRWKDRTIDRFVDFVSRHNLESRLVVESNLDDEPDDPATLADVYTYAKNYPYEATYLSGGEEKPVYRAVATDNPNYIELGEVVYHLTQYRLTLLDVDEHWGGESVNFAVQLRRY